MLFKINKVPFIELISNLNCLMLLIGFPLFTLIAYGNAITTSSNMPSIIFRALHLGIALLIIVQSKDRIYISKGVSLLIIFLLIFCRIVYDGYVRFDSVDMPRSVSSMLILETVGFTFIPVYALVRSFSYVNLNIVAKYCFWGLLIMMLIFLFRLLSGSVLIENGRVSLSVAQSTLALAKFGGWLMLFSYYFYLFSFDKKRKIFYALVAILGLYCSFTAGSRGAVVGNIAAFLFLYFVTKKVYKLLIPMLLLFLVFILFSDEIVSFFYDLFPTLFKRFSATINKGDTSGRLEIFEYCLQQFWNNPIFGDWILKGSLKSIHLTAHNLTLEILSSLGLFGTSFLMYFYLKCFYAIFIFVKYNENLLWCALFVCMFVMSFSGGSLRNPDYSTIYMIILLLYGKYKIQNSYS